MVCSVEGHMGESPGPSSSRPQRSVSSLVGSSGLPTYRPQRWDLLGFEIAQFLDRLRSFVRRCNSEYNLHVQEEDRESLQAFCSAVFVRMSGNHLRYMLFLKEHVDNFVSQVQEINSTTLEVSHDRLLAKVQQLITAMITYVHDHRSLQVDARQFRTGTRSPASPTAPTHHRKGGPRKLPYEGLGLLGDMLREARTVVVRTLSHLLHADLETFASQISVHWVNGRLVTRDRAVLGKLYVMSGHILERIKKTLREIVLRLCRRNSSATGYAMSRVQEICKLDGEVLDAPGFGGVFSMAMNSVADMERMFAELSACLDSTSESMALDTSPSPRILSPVHRESSINAPTRSFSVTTPRVGLHDGAGPSLVERRKFTVREGPDESLV